MELLSYPELDEEAEKSICEFLDSVLVLNLTKAVKTSAIVLRRKYNLKLPDAIIAATAVTNSAIFYSNDKKLKTIDEIHHEDLSVLS